MKKAFFLRFYGAKSKERAQTVLTYAHMRGHQFGFKFEPVTRSVNLPVYQESIQVDLFFDSTEKLTGWKNDQDLKAFYSKHATLDGAEVVTRRPGDLAFAN